ncbi:MAG TPA: EAL domain-containing protein, partial [Telmatospirillum sp.]|nr:EAL domain-containing protein [Telmatospirillum sp.]
AFYCLLGGIWILVSASPVTFWGGTSTGSVMVGKELAIVSITAILLYLFMTLAIREKPHVSAQSVIREISERKDAELALSNAQSRALLQESRDLLLNLVAQVPGIVFQYRLYPDGRSGFPFINEAVQELYGLSPEQVQDDAAAIFAYQHPDDAAGITASIQDSARTLGIWHHEYRIQLPHLGVRWRLGNAKPQKLEDGSILWHGFITDITERKAAQEQIEFLAQHDALTKLPNRLLGKDRMERAMVVSHRLGRKTALLFVDVDHFKRINDSLGQAVGDALLQTLAQRFQGCIRETDTLCRQGADEFLVILPSIEDPETINRVAAQILQKMAILFKVDDLELHPTVSIGISVYPDDGVDFDSLLKRAETAVYHAKESGRNTYRFFADQMNVDADEYLIMLNGLRGALDRQEFVLHYQPQIDLAKNQIIGSEALIRWNHPELGLVAPGRFISIAEDSGLIVEIGEWVLQEACRQAAVWRKAGLKEMVVAVNLSAIQFRRGELLQSVGQALALSGLDPHCLELELTESILIEDTANVLSVVKQLKSLGVKLSLDDFGTGYSSLAYLRRLDLDKLKIDQSFVRDIAGDPNNETLVKAIVQMAQGLGLRTIAEGVEDSATLDVIRRHGCDEVQGFHFAKAMPAEQFARYVSEHVSPAMPPATPGRDGEEQRHRTV